MEVDSDSELLTKAASGAAVEAGLWPGLRDDIVARLDKIAHNDFPIPHLPPPPARLSLASAASVCNPRPTSPVASSSSPSPPPPPPPERASAEQEEEEEEEAYGKEQTPAPRGEELPRQIANQLADITARLRTFTTYAPHTIQRLAELVLRPRAHYKALASYLHAVDRVVQVTSGTNVYPLPPAIPDMSTINVGVNGAGADEAAARDPAATVTWSNPTTAAAALGSDEALGGALLTPIPWLTRRSPDSNSSGGDAATAAAGGSAAGARIHSEGTETIDGPNGMGRIETVSVSVNGVPSTGHARGVTQGELLRQEQRAGVVPVSQLSRSSQDMMPGGGGGGEEDRSMVDDNDDVVDDDDDTNNNDSDGRVDDDEGREIPHVRGPEEIGVNDTGPQTVTTSCMGEDGVQMQGIDVAAAVGRKHDEAPPPAAQQQQHKAEAQETDGRDSDDGTPAKREAEQPLETDTPKRAKEEDGADPAPAAAEDGEGKRDEGTMEET